MAEAPTMDRAGERPTGMRRRSARTASPASAPRPRPGSPAVRPEAQALRPATVRPRARIPGRPQPKAAAPAKAKRRWLRPVLFAALPLALAVGGYEYVTGGQLHVDRERLRAGGHGRRLDRRVGHRQGDRRPREPEGRRRRRPVPPRRPAVPAGAGARRRAARDRAQRPRRAQGQLPGPPGPDPPGRRGRRLLHDPVQAPAAARLQQLRPADRARPGEARPADGAGEARLAGRAARRRGGQPERRPERPGRGPPPLQGGARGPRRGGAPALAHGRAGLDSRDRHQRPLAAAGPVPGRVHGSASAWWRPTMSGSRPRRRRPS